MSLDSIDRIDEQKMEKWMACNRKRKEKKNIEKERYGSVCGSIPYLSCKVSAFSETETGAAASASLVSIDVWVDGS